MTDLNHLIGLSLTWHTDDTSKGLYPYKVLAAITRGEGIKGVCVDEEGTVFECSLSACFMSPEVYKNL